ncbi:MAG TPA: isoprenylcysteine carboxylmethyltransferase family protein [Candidatus Paceibacterota bacterium]|nr:isoprenylcysteine carboxylmethyltransferase family protein [Candidatus Paceibacterota bacterium]
MEDTTQKYQDNKIHFILGHGYFVFLIVIILGIISDFFLKMKIFSNDVYQYVGAFLLVTSSVITYWAQKTSSNYKQKIQKDSNISLFEQGPYKYIRHPTYLSLFLMTIGLCLIINSFSSIIFAVIAYLIIRIFFLRKEEKILENKYGETYSEYKKKVKNWI